MGEGPSTEGASPGIQICLLSSLLTSDQVQAFPSREQQAGSKKDAHVLLSCVQGGGEELKGFTAQIEVLDQRTCFGLSGRGQV